MTLDVNKQNYLWMQSNLTELNRYCVDYWWVCNHSPLSKDKNTSYYLKGDSEYQQFNTAKNRHLFINNTNKQKYTVLLILKSHCFWSQREHILNKIKFLDLYRYFHNFQTLSHMWKHTRLACLSWECPLQSLSKSLSPQLSSIYFILLHYLTNSITSSYFWCSIQFNSLEN